MPIFLDDLPFGVGALSSDATIEQLCEAARSSLRGSGRMLMTVRCDEAEIAPDQLDAVLDQKASGFNRLDLVSARPRDLVREALTDCAGMLANTFPAMKDAAAALGEGRVGPAMTALAECAGTWGQIHDSVVKSGALLGLNYGTLVLNGRSVLDELRALAAGLSDLKRAVESRDHVLLGDILNYEFDSTLQRWETVLHGLIAHVQSDGRSSK